MNQTWRITIYRNDSETPVVYEKVKHYWWDSRRLKIAIYKQPPEHYYITWPERHISHIKAEREDYSMDDILDQMKKGDALNQIRGL